jgi:hypothetical protein
MRAEYFFWEALKQSSVKNRQATVKKEVKREFSE